MPRSHRDSADPAQRAPATRPASAKAEAAASPKRSARERDEVPGISMNEAGSGASEATDDQPVERSSDASEVPSSPDADLPSDAALVLDDLVPPDARELHHGETEREIDAELVRKAQGGDHTAFRQLFDRYHKRVYAVAFGVLKNRHDALDCVQEGFVKVHRHLPNFQGSSSFYTWLYRIVMNLAIDQLRRRKTSKPVEFDDTLRRDSQEPGDDAIVSRMLDENPRKAVIRRELLERVQIALGELPEYHRQVILLREIEGMSYEEMAEALDVPKGTIMSRLFHARKKMQEALKGYVDGDLDLEE